MDALEFDVVVVGAGPAGEVCAGRLAEGGMSVALVERELVGGECSFFACMPSKALLRPAQALAEARRVPGAAEAAEGELDIAAVLARRDEIVHGLRDDEQLPWLRERHVVLVRGRGTLAGERSVRVERGDDERRRAAEDPQGGTPSAAAMGRDAPSTDEIVLNARWAVVLATGSAAALPPIEGLREARPWTNREATTAGQVPASLLVLGGGVVGVEMAQAYASLGARVTVIEAGLRLIAGEEELASEQVLDGLRDAGVEVLLGVAARAVRREGRGPVTVELEGGGERTAAELLVAVGRRAHSDALGLREQALIDPDSAAGRPVEVDDRLRVARRDWLFAIGDVNGRAQLTHMGKYQGRFVADLILARDDLIAGGLHFDGRRSPRVIFTEPQVAAVGYTLRAAQDAGVNARAVDQPIEANAGGSFVGRGAPGTARLVIDEDRRILVGATFTGVEVAEQLHAATIAIVGEIPLERLWHAVACFPTRSEVWLRLLEAYGL